MIGKVISEQSTVIDMLCIKALYGMVINVRSTQVYRDNYKRIFSEVVFHD